MLKASAKKYLESENERQENVEKGKTRNYTHCVHYKARRYSELDYTSDP